MSLHHQPRRTRGRAVALAAAVAVVASLAGPAAAAYAAPAPAPAHAATALPKGDSPLLGAGLSLDLNAALNLEAKGIVTAAIGGAVEADGAVQLKVAKGSKLSYDKRKKGVRGKVALKGGIQLAKGAKKVAISNLMVDIRTGVITAKVGAKANVQIGMVNEAKSAEVVLEEGTTTATIKLGNQGIKLDAKAVAEIGASLGACLDVDADVDVDAALDVDVDLKAGTKVNADLVVALGLDADIDLDLNVSALLDLGLDLDISLL